MTRAPLVAALLNVLYSELTLAALLLIHSMLLATMQPFQDSLAAYAEH